MAIGDIIVGVDIGASKISLVVGEVNNFNQIEVICNTTKKSDGIQKDKIVDETKLGDAIASTIEDAEKEMSMKINSAYITIPGKYVTIVQNSVTREAKDKYSGISQKDVSNALMHAKDISIPEGKKLIDVVTEDFKLDDGRSVENPVGAFSSSFILNAELILADKEYIKTIMNVFRRLNISIDGMVPIKLAEKNLILTDNERKACTMLVDIGAQNTDIGVFYNDKFVYTDSIPVGGQNITNDIAIVLNISNEEAEKLKKQYGLALKAFIENDNEVILNTAKDNNKIVMSSHIVEIIEARVDQIFEIIDEELVKNQIKSHIDSVVLTGQGITNIMKSDTVAKNNLNLPVRINKEKTANYMKPTYETAYALVNFIASRPFAKSVSSSVDTNSNEKFFKKVLEKIKEFFYS